jgi:hypothetical protein
LYEFLYLFFVVFSAYLIKGITGFGNTLIMAPLFSFVVSNRITTPVDLLFSLPTNAYIVWRERKHVKLKIIIPLMIMLSIGAIPGVLFLKLAEDYLLKAILGVVIMGVGFEMLWRHRIHSSVTNNKAVLIATGLISGCLSGLYGIAAPIIAYVNRMTANRNEFRANICSVFLFDNLFRFFSYGLVGIMTVEVIQYALFLLPAVIVGMAIGVRLDLKMKEKTVKNLIIILLIASGFGLFLKNVIMMI